ncbi:hypothetical protein [Streptomyces avidinii]|uniref:Negative regulator of RcsB-dependent stress response n=1 Tax=Streptomyces avidinii TaxID=1895 RepID=A0ABS4KZ48_STRAV|nr:hypothetical protein [Streptomyces avidinii]MBP2035308.1 putative negative regulator of RcsB-dependent stress response [Streptomyces avidinii]GGZ03404.1 hypothetical protein GCM10010343_31500 [Streptomyces avidinii]
MPADRLRFHSRAAELAGLDPEVSKEAEAALDRFESLHGRVVPAAVREWFALAQGADALRKFSNDDMVYDADRLGREEVYYWPEDNGDWPDDVDEQEERQLDPVGSLGLLPFLVENQGVWVMAVRLDGSEDPRLGARAPMSPELLAVAVPGYLDRTEQATAGPHWLREALEYATTRLHGAASALRPIGTMGRTTGYLVADYLLQQAGRSRGTVAVPETVWQALAEYHHPRDTQGLARSAERWGERRYAEELHRIAADRGDIHSGMQLGKLLLAAGRIEELRARADGGDRGANSELVNLLAREGDLAGLRGRSRIGDPVAARLLVSLLLQQGRVEEALSHLEAWAHAGDASAERYIRKIIDEQERFGELRTRADEGDVNAAWSSAELMVKYGRIEELRARADAGDRPAAHELANELARRGEIGELRARAATGESAAGQVLAHLLASQDRLEEALTVLRRLAEAGDESAACRLAELLAEHGGVEEALAILRGLTDSGYHAAWYRLANLLAEDGDLEGAVAIVLAQPHAGGALINVAPVSTALAAGGRLDDLRALADAGSMPAEQSLAHLLEERGDLDELRARADAGGHAAAGLYNALLRRSGRLDELRARAQAGDRIAESLLEQVVAEPRRAEPDHDSDQVTTFLPPWRPNIGPDRPPRR